MLRIIKFILSTLLIITILFISSIIIYIFSVRHYRKKLEQTEIDTPVSQIIEEWGTPDEKFTYEKQNSFIYKYRKDIIGWDVYIFAFTAKDSILAGKYIDD